MSSQSIELREFKWGLATENDSVVWLIVLKPYHMEVITQRNQLRAEGQHFYVMGIIANPRNIDRGRYKQSYISYDASLKTKTKRVINLSIEDQAKLRDRGFFKIESFIILLAKLGEEMDGTIARFTRKYPHVKRIDNLKGSEEKITI